MKSDTPSYHGYRFPPEIISHAVWLYHRFGVSFRDVEDLLTQRGVTVSYEAIRLWYLTFGSAYARRLKRRQGRRGDTWCLRRSLLVMWTYPLARKGAYASASVTGAILDCNLLHRKVLMSHYQQRMAQAPRVGHKPTGYSETLYDGFTRVTEPVTRRRQWDARK